MTTRQNKWIKRKIKKVKMGNCEGCGLFCKREFAHKEPTGLSGNGRGRKERYYDWKNNKDKYHLLCKMCHEMYDYGALTDKEIERGENK